MLTTFSYSFPIFFFLIMLACFYGSKPRVTIGQNTIFTRLLCINMATIVLSFFGIFSTVHLPNLSILTQYVLYTICSLLFFLESYLFFCYTMSLQNHAKTERDRRYGLLSNGLMVGFIAFAFSTYWTHWLFYIDEMGYQKGKYFWIAYLLYFGLVALSYFHVFYARERLEKESSVAIYHYLSILCIGGILGVWTRMPIVLNLFCSFSIFVIYLAFENPDYFINKRAGIFNTNAFVKKLNEEKGKQNALYAVGFAVKNYNVIRASYQAQTTDEGLKEIGKYIRKISPSSFYLRNGLYFILLNEGTDRNRVLQDLQDVFRRPWVLKHAEISFDVEFIRFDPDLEYRNAQQLLDAIHLALQDTAFLNTGEDIRITNETIRKTTRQAMVQQSLLSHLERNDLTIVYQPIVRASTKEVVGAEALTRIYDEKMGEIKPSEFIPIAESSGKIGELSVQVLEKVFQFAAGGGMEQNHFEWVNVNLSPLNCLNKNLPEILMGLVEKTGVNPEIIHLEITEEAMIDPAVLEMQIQTLKEKGFQFVLDDYGSGYANQSRAMRYPFTNIKLDMEIIQDYFDSYNSLLPATIDMFRRNGYSITAEGIETEDMVKRLTHLGADYLQGYYFSKPLKERELNQWTIDYMQKRSEEA